MGICFNHKIVGKYLLYTNIVNLVFLYTNFYKGRTGVAALWGVVTLAIYILCTKENFVKNIKSSYMYLVNKLSFSFGVLYFIYGLIFKNITYLSLGCTFAFILPQLISLNQDEIYAFISEILKIVNVVAIFIVVVTIFMYPLKAGTQYGGITGNPNSIGQLITASLLINLYYTSKTKGFSVRQVLILIFIATLMSLMILGASRTTMLASSLIYFIFIVFEDKNRLKNLLKVFLIGLISIIVFLGIFNIMTRVSPIFKMPHYSSGQLYSSEKESLEDTFQLLEKRTSQGKNNNGTFTTGRMAIWKEYIRHSSFVGHNGKGVYVPEFNRNITPHNAFINVLYESGIPGVALFILIFVNMLYHVFKILKKKRVGLEIFLVLSILFENLASMMFSTSYSPYGNVNMFIMWFICLPLIYSLSGDCKK